MTQSKFSPMAEQYHSATVTKPILQDVAEMRSKLTLAEESYHIRQIAILADDTESFGSSDLDLQRIAAHAVAAIEARRRRVQS